MFPISHFLAFEYKIRNPEVTWIAEFGDPNLVDIKCNKRYSKIDVEDMNRLRKIINEHGYTTPDTDNLFFYSEYLPYVFADKIIFTNEIQRELMLNYFEIDELKEEIFEKSVFSHHPIPDKTLYEIKQTNYDKIEKDKVNFAYFGVFYDTRNIYNVLSSLYALDETLQEKVCIHLFVSNSEKFRKIIVNNTPVKENIIVNDYVSYLEFLNLTEKFDCLIVNDAKTTEYYDKNPYLPSKISDYMGSSTDVWKICEKDSTLSQIDTKYTSYLDNIFTVEETLKQIIKDKM
ncbi:hypothetical protein [Methanosphaera sp.]